MISCRETLDDNLECNLCKRKLKQLLSPSSEAQVAGY